MPSVSNYWPANFWQAMNQALAWLYGRQNAFAGNWLADALGNALLATITSATVGNHPPMRPCPQEGKEQ